MRITVCSNCGFEAADDYFDEQMQEKDRQIATLKDALVKERYAKLIISGKYREGGIIVARGHEWIDQAEIEAMEQLAREMPEICWGDAE